jgi:uncharacterized damage-inducible protein DinB
MNIEGLKNSSVFNLKQLVGLVNQLSNEQYTDEFPLLSGNSMGKHIRHVIELYQEFFAGLLHGEVNYDNRQRNLQLETNKSLAIITFDQVILEIENLSKDDVLVVKANFGGESTIELKSSICRELAYNLEHAIHHMAILQICVKHYFPFVVLSPDFGLAYSTIKFNQTHVHPNVSSSK